MESKLKLAGQAYEKGLTCSQAIFCAYTKDMGIDQTTACRIMEGFGGGFGGMQEICGALAAATAIISFYSSDGTPSTGAKRQQTYNKVCCAVELFQKEYGGITCREILHGERPKAFQCGMKVKDTILIINHILRESAKGTDDNTR
ncbi:C_GCAxxG_C_C family protein [Erysipelotrichaceae bacterium AF15-26LB]|jgi:C_GCAxxG_C_C family probable redox protein|nr:oxidoreductase [Erysipelotrichaceae bacterium 3_1_53]MCR0346931.1 C-GCAxxG-C-C family protein [[Clostridium] innocuum]RJV89700.1 C_GCAxxG_C_C family protein [Erysipelotrichaceae bacterium AF15-26LB]RJV91285.1 C_GCAxxG_C_C family protein [Erysipelotrichaceae bacterium AF19-24AC]